MGKEEARDSADRIARVIFGVLLAMCVVLGATFFVEERPFEDVAGTDAAGQEQVERVYQGHGVTHASYPGMRSGGDGAARQASVFWIGFAFALLQMVLITLCLGFALARKDGAGQAWFPLVISGLVACGVIVGMFLTYRSYLHESELLLLFGFPVPTAFVLYGLWAFPYLFAAVFVGFFDSWYLPEGSLQLLRRDLGSKLRSD